MSNVSEDNLTSNQRYIVSWACDEIMNRVELVKKQLGSVWEEFFATTEYKELDEYTRDDVGDKLFLLFNALHDAVVLYAAKTGATYYQGIDQRRFAAKRSVDTYECEELVDKARKVGEKMLGEGRAAFMERLNEIRDMTDDKAIPLLKELLKETGAKK